MRHRNAATLWMLLLCSCTGGLPVDDLDREARNCPGGYCEPPDDLPGDEPEEPELPFCGAVCHSTASCSIFCTTGNENTTCGQLGMCESCSSTVCNSPGKCGRYCMHGGATAIPCHQYAATTAGDGDIDGVPDALELALARRFFPILRMKNTWIRNYPEGDAGELYAVGSRMVGGHPNWPFVVRPVTPHLQYNVGPDDGYSYYTTITDSCLMEGMQCLEIVYTIPYNWDLGDIEGFGSHRGDSEMYAVLVARRDTRSVLNEYGNPIAPRWNNSWAVAKSDAGAWKGVAEFTAAHMCTVTEGSKLRERINQPLDPGVAPTRVWAAEGKHATYFSKAECNSGGLWNSDNCDDNQFDLVYATQFPNGGPLANAGEQTCHPLTSFFPGTNEPSYSPYNFPLWSPYHYVWSGLKFGTASAFRDKLRPGTVKWWPQWSFTCWPSDPPPTTTNPLPENPPIEGQCRWNEECCEDYPGHCRCIPIGADCE